MFASTSWVFFFNIKHLHCNQKIIFRVIFLKFFFIIIICAGIFWQNVNMLVNLSDINFSNSNEICLLLIIASSRN